MSDTFTTTSSQSWFGRIGGAIKGIVFGFILVAVGIGLLFWNEGRAVKTHRALVESQGSVQTLPTASYDPQYEDQLVHVAGEVKTAETLSDPIFNLSEQALKLSRVVETYQWSENQKSETQKKLGGGTETVTTYTYTRGWHQNLIDSSRFAKPDNHQNPPNVAYQSHNMAANKMTIGDYELSRPLSNLITNYIAYAPSPDASNLDNLKLVGDTFYTGNSANQPDIGDQRIRFEIIYPQEYSIVAHIHDHQLAPHTASNGRTVALLETGIQTADSMFEQAKADNATLTWILRGVGTIMLIIGFGMVMKLFSVIADIVPFAGNLVEMGTGLIAFLVGSTIALLTISIAWIAYRPLLGGGLIAGPLILIWIFKQKHHAAKQRVADQQTIRPEPSTRIPPPAPPC